jgi:hypothetical protein
MLDTFKTFLHTYDLLPVAKSDTFFIYTDIIEAENMGGKEVRCLRTVNVQNALDNINVEFKNIQYCRVKKPQT